MKNKAQLGFLQILIIVLVGAIVLFFVFIGIILPLISDDYDVELCRTTALVNDVHRTKNPLSKEQILDLKCPMKEVVITEKDVLFKKEINKRMFFTKIAEEMRTCWYMMGEGEFKPVDQNILYGSTNPCIVCAHISFDDKLKKRVEKEGIVFDGFFEFLNETPMLKSDMSYYEYLSREYLSVDYYFLFHFSNQENTLKMIDSIDYNDDYFIIYNMYLPDSLVSQENRFNKFLSKIENFLPSWLGDGITGDTENVFIYLVSSKEVYNVGCDYIVNTIN
jgi:hypothetical protein